jgi:ribosomal protein S18 acetylase RimI-like enzyme
MSTPHTAAASAAQIHDFQIVPTTLQDWDQIMRLFEQALDLQGQNGYKVWSAIDQPALRADIEQGLHYKITAGPDLLCIFSVLYRDPLIWGEREQDDAIYLHRVVANPAFKGQQQFAKVLAWARQQAARQQRRFVRLDTWADNHRIIEYYRSFGFVLLGEATTPDSPGLPMQNRNLRVALLELPLA